MTARQAQIRDVVSSIESANPWAAPDVPFNYIDIASVDNRLKLITSPRRLLGREAPSRARQRVRSGDVLIATTRPYLNAVAMVPAALDGEVCSTGFAVLRANESIDARYLFLFVQSQAFVQPLSALVQGALYPAVSDRDVLAQRIPVPERDAQRRIAEVVNMQLAQVASAREAAIDRSKLSREVGLCALAQAFRHPSDEWPRRRLGDIAESRRSPSVASDGDTAVTTVTSGCLTPFGFSFDGLGVGRMSSRDAIDGVLAADEVLVSRSNTEEFVGRASRYPGNPVSVVASDLVFRLVADPSAMTAEYLAGYLSVLQLEGYWRDRSSGASSTMKKITKTLLLNVEIPLPSLQEQLRVTAELRERLATINALETAIRAERDAIEALPAALLRRAFEDLAA